jgi:methylglutaconyl-CoA hydratase
MVKELSETFLLTSRDSQIKVIILAAEGESYSTNKDEEYIKEISEYTFEQHQQEAQRLNRLYTMISSIRKPVIALVNGAALDNGCALLSVCDFVFAGRETSSFGFPQMKYGIVPVVALQFLLRKIGDSYTREFLLSGNNYTVDDAFRICLINKIFPAIELEKNGVQFADELTKQSNLLTFGLLKETLSRIYGMTLNDATDYCINVFAVARMTEDAKKQIEAKFSNKIK